MRGPGPAIGRNADRAIAANPTYAKGWALDLAQLEGQLAVAQRQPKRALAAFDRALRMRPSPDAAARQAAVLASHGYYRQALAHLDTYEAVRGRVAPPGHGMPALHAWVLERQGYWASEMRVLRDKLQAEIDAEGGRMNALPRSATPAVARVFALLVLGVMAAYYAIFFLPPRLVGANDPDRYYHLGLAAITSKQGLPATLPQVEDLGWGRYFPDKEFLFHAATGAADWLAGPSGVMAVVPISGIAIVLCLYFGLRRVLSRGALPRGCW